VRTEGTEFLVPSRTGTWFPADWAGRHPSEADRLLRMLRDTPPEGYAACCEAIGAFDVRDRLAGITTPTLAVAGAEDPATPPDTVRVVADGIPGADLVVVPAAAHLPNATDPATVNAALRAHLGG
jgi:3-oxoadipate enol-lactonase